MKSNQLKPFEPSLVLNLENNLEFIFKLYYKFVFSSVYKILPDPTLAEDLAQDVFYDLWKKRGQLKIKTSLSTYLKKMATNKALNYLRENGIISGEWDSDIPKKIQSPKYNESLEYAELQDYINSTIDKLPQQCRIVFMLSRFEDYSYKEISKELGISTKTVENQISKALRVLRNAMKKYEDQADKLT